MRQLLRIIIFAVVCTGCLLIRPSYAATPTASVHIALVAGDSCIFSGQNEDCQPLAVTLRRIKQGVAQSPLGFLDLETYWDYRWEATCHNVAFGPDDVQLIGTIITWPGSYDQKMELIKKYIASIQLWFEPGERLYVF